MTQKQEAIQGLPDDSSLEEITDRLQLLAGIQKGLDQLDRGDSVPHEEVER